MMQKNEIVKVKIEDIGVGGEGIGKVDGALKDLYQTVLSAHEMALEAVRPGAVCEEVDKVARDFIEARYPGSFGHALGHGVGLDIHEQPNASPANEKPMPEGAVISAEPGIYLPGLGGVRIEDLCIVEQDGHRNLCRSSKELITL